MMMSVAPTSRLPPIAEIASCTLPQLSDTLRYLAPRYQPPVRGSRRRRRSDGGDDLHRVRPDAFERAYAIRWLTALIAQLEARHEPPSTESDTDTDHLLRQAASLLAACAGVAAAGIVQRRFTFGSALTGKIHVTLTDIPLDNHDPGSVGAQTWGGACVLAEMIAEDPDRFGLGTRLNLRARRHGLVGGPPSRPLRILELGAGTGLVGLTVAKLLEALSPMHTHARRTTIVLTDCYPAVLANLCTNIDTNFPPVTGDTNPVITVSSHSLDWSSFSTADTIPDVLSAPFDVVLGADIVYEAQHAVWIRDCLASLLSYPDGPDGDPVFHLMLPLRATHTLESSTIEQVFGSKDRMSGGSLRQLGILSKESILCEAYEDGNFERSCVDDDVEYVYYRIGWIR